MKNNYNFETPILFLIFSRPELTNMVFDKIKSIQPKKLYVAADGPRNEIEKLKTDETRKIINNVNWECEVKTLFREQNLGCKKAVSEGISWFFLNEEQGIILEDDCLPDKSFFRYCEELLIKYRDNEKVFMISGQKPIGFPVGKNKLIFTKRSYIWGWATWRRSWREYNIDVVKDECVLKKIQSISLLEKPLLKKRNDDIKSGKINTWDFQLEILQRIKKSYCIIPSANLVENIGFNISTHNFNKIDILFQNRKKRQFVFPIKYPAKITNNKLFDGLFLLQNLLRILLKKIIKTKG